MAEEVHLKHHTANENFALKMGRGSTGFCAQQISPWSEEVSLQNL